MRQPPEHFGEQDLELVFVARKLDEALGVEDLLTQTEIDYLVETDTYKGGVIFPSERVGAFFYVLPETAESVRTLLSQAGYRPFRTDNP
ncbi:MAG: hypothetical protein RL328_594 [Acidobacteriota bacterium]|jgi:hypothetical protein